MSFQHSYSLKANLHVHFFKMKSLKHFFRSQQRRGNVDSWSSLCLWQIVTMSSGIMSCCHDVITLSSGGGEEWLRRKKQQQCFVISGSDKWWGYIVSVWARDGELLRAGRCQEFVGICMLLYVWAMWPLYTWLAWLAWEAAVVGGNYINKLD